MAELCYKKKKKKEDIEFVTQNMAFSEIQLLQIVVKIRSC